MRGLILKMFMSMLRGAATLALFCLVPSNARA
jgi:hypothetical protein